MFNFKSWSDSFGNNLDIVFELAQEVENICHQYINALESEYLRFYQKRNENCLRKNEKL